MFALVDSEQREAAVARCQTDLVPAFERYSEAVKRPADYNIQQGRERGQAIQLACRVTQWVVGGIVALLFMAGFFIGLYRQGTL